MTPEQLANKELSQYRQKRDQELLIQAMKVCYRVIQPSLFLRIDGFFR